VVQRQARLSLAAALGFAVLASIALVVPHDTGRWLPLHLFLVGAVLLAVSGATQLFAVTWAAGPPPSDPVAGVQRGLLAGGALLLAAARELGWPDAVVGLGGAAVVAALGVLGRSLHHTVAAGVQRRFDPALRAYLAALAAGAVGSAVGIALAVLPAGSMHPRLRTVHLALNLFGLVGLVIVGTLPFFAATQLRVRASTRAGSRAQTALIVWLGGALGLAAAGLAGAWRVPAALGFAAYAVGLVRLATLLPAFGAKQLRWSGPRALQLAAGLAWWAAMTVAAAAQAARHDPVLPPWSVAVLVVGGYAPILAGSLAYLGPVLRGGGHEALTAGFRATRSWFGLVAGNAAAVAIVAGFERVAAAAVALWVVDAAARALLLARRRPPTR
jgi:nitrite reductase (NO-forming)